MHLLSTILFAVSANLDCFSIAIAYGIKKSKIPLYYNIFIALVASIGTYISMELGHLITDYISLDITEHIGSSIITIIGIYVSIGYFRNKKKDTNNDIEVSVSSDSKPISFKETLLLSLALTLNNLALGISASISGVPVLGATLFTFVCSFSFIEIGQRLGNSYLSNILGKYAPLFTGILLIFLGSYELFI